MVFKIAGSCSASDAVSERKTLIFFVQTKPTISSLLRLLLNVMFISTVLLCVFMSRHAVKINLHWEDLDMHKYFFLDIWLT